MILVTVGTQLPFPRLIDYLDDLAPTLGRPIIAQIGLKARPPRNIESHAQMTPPVFDEAFRKAEVIVSHAGIGTVLAAKRHSKPIIIVPRRAALGEHRNDHQLATARQMTGQTGIHVAFEMDQLKAMLEADRLDAPSSEAGAHLASLVSAIRSFTVSR